MIAIRLVLQRIRIMKDKLILRILVEEAFVIKGEIS